MKRNKFSLSNYKLLTADMGQLVPVNLQEVLPGDSFLGNSSALIRMTPLVAPVMHPVQVRIHHWFVPTRLLWSGWESFITGGNDGEGDSTTYPTISSGAGYSEGDLPDYMGVPVSVANLSHSALPIRAYNMIFNENYRDQDTVTAVTEDSTTVQRIAWEKDYFTASRPWPQRGPEVTLPLGNEAPVLGIGTDDDNTFPEASVAIHETGASDRTYANAAANSGTGTNRFFLEEDPSNNNYPYVRADLSAATSASVNDIREAFALQRYQEARARYGARYTEYLRYCGVVPSDARLQRPEYLGGGKQLINFSEVLQTSETATTPLGTLGGHGIAALGTRKYMRFFSEHGYVMSLLSVRPKSIYSDGLERHWNRTTKEDYFQKELEHIGQQAILNKEIYAQGTGGGTDDNDIFGYQDRYTEYRSSRSTIAGEFRNATFDDWHLARLFASLPALNQSFTDCDPADRIFSTTTVNNMQIMVQNSVKARRMVSRTQQNKII